MQGSTIQRTSPNGRRRLAHWHWWVLASAIAVAIVFLFVSKVAGATEAERDSVAATVCQAQD